MNDSTKGEAGSTFREPPPIPRGQCALILRLLCEARGAWVPLPLILALGVAQYNARVFELRRAGHPIENKTERDAAGRVLSWFRLIEPS